MGKMARKITRALDEYPAKLYSAQGDDHLCGCLSFLLRMILTTLREFMRPKTR